MTPDVDEYGQPLRAFPAQWNIVVLAALGAGVLQAGWLEIANRSEQESYWPLDAWLLVVATGYLLATAWLHARTWRWRPNELVSRLWQLGSALAMDAMLCLMAIWILVKGSAATTLRAGLWIAPPVVIAVGVASILITLLALRDGWKRLSDVPPADAPLVSKRRDLPHTVMGTAVFVTLVLLEYFLVTFH